MSKEPVYSIDDFKGLKIQAPEVDLYVSTFKAMGANPTPIALAETYTSLQSGVVDAVEMGLEYIYTNKFYEVCDYYTLLAFRDKGHVKIDFVTNMLPPKLRKICYFVSNVCVIAMLLFLMSSGGLRLPLKIL